MTNLTVEDIANVCHEGNKMLCELQGDFSQDKWNEAEEWQRQSAIRGVQFKLEHPEATPEDQHAAWCRDKVKDGWQYGPVKCAKDKTHPCLIPYDGLPLEQRAKDSLFVGIVNALKPLL